MPTYTYHCPEHGEFEEFHSITTQLEECPQCKKDNKISKVSRLINSGSFILVGDCWAKDSYSK